MTSRRLLRLEIVLWKWVIHEFSRSLVWIVNRRTTTSMAHLTVAFAFCHCHYSCIGMYCDAQSVKLSSIRLLWKYMRRGLGQPRNAAQSQARQSAFFAQSATKSSFKSKQILIAKYEPEKNFAVWKSKTRASNFKRMLVKSVRYLTPLWNISAYDTMILKLTNIAASDSTPPRVHSIPTCGMWNSCCN